jgi:ATP-dependent protease HslVU (ClpYQ) peptidase subunit
MKNLTLTETIQQIDTWIEDVQFDLTQDWNDDKELMSVQLQQLMVAKSNLELILKTGGQILDSSIQK